MGWDGIAKTRANDMYELHGFLPETETETDIIQATTPRLAPKKYGRLS